MFVVLQIPLADGRRFIAGETTRLDRPDWSAAANRTPDFLRSMGAVRDRPNRGVDGWINEDLICDAGRWLRFDPAEARVMTHPAGPLGLFRPVFRRWISDGQFLVRLEVGWQVQLARDHGDWAPARIAQLLDVFLQQPVVVGGLGEPDRKIPLHQLPAQCLRAYRRASTRQAAGEAAIPPDSVRPGPALVYLELEADELPALAVSAAVPVAAPAGLEGLCAIRLWRHRAAGQSYACCFVSSKESGPWSRAGLGREVRVNLMRMHSEFHGLDFLHVWERRRRAAAGEIDTVAVTSHVEKALVALRPDRGERADRQGFRAARAAVSAVTGGRIDTLIADFALRYEDPSERMLRTLRSNYPELAPQITVNSNRSTINAGAGANVAVAQGAGNSGNVTASVQNITRSDRYQAALRDFEKALQEASGKIDARTAGRLQDKLEDLKKPDKKPEWYQVTAEGLKEAAEAVKEIAAPVAAAAATILGILLGTG